MRFTSYLSGGCGVASTRIEEVGPTVVLGAAFDGEQGVGSRLRPVAFCPFESAAADSLAGAFRAAGSDRQSALSAEVVAYSIVVGLLVANAGRDRFGPAKTSSTRPSFGAAANLSTVFARTRFSCSPELRPGFAWRRSCRKCLFCCRYFHLSQRSNFPQFQVRPRLREARRNSLCRDLRRWR